MLWRDDAARTSGVNNFNAGLRANTLRQATAAISQLGVPSPIRAPEARCTRLRSKGGKLLVNRLGVGNEESQFNVAVRLRHDNKTVFVRVGAGINESVTGRPGG